MADVDPSARLGWRERSAWIGAGIVGLLLIAWVTGAFAAPAPSPGTCFDYPRVEDAEGAATVPCSEPHTGQMVAFLAPSLDGRTPLIDCRSAVRAWLSAAKQRSHARSAFREVVVPVDGAWRRSGYRCDVVRAAFSATRGTWTPAAVVGSAQGAMSGKPSTWVQCRRRVGDRQGASATCGQSSKRLVQFAFTVKTTGPYRRDAATRAMARACSTAARGEVRKGASPVLVSTIDRAAWRAGKTAGGSCTFTTKVWKHAG